VNIGIVDSLVYADQLEEIAKQEFGKRVKKLSGKQYASRKHHKYDWGAEPKLAVVYAAGMIAPGKSIGQGPGEPDFWSSGLMEPFSALPIPRVMGSETITNAIEKAREDSSIKAIVLRVDSGGGSAFASDLIWREVMLTKDRKPVIVSMGGMAASGGYYIACPADVIVAEPGTVTGSIGVIAGKFSLRGLYDKLGVNKEILKRGENSDIYTTYSSFTDEQREIIHRQIRELYDDFVHKAARGRNTTKEAIEPIAQGRIWTGRQAKDNGLVDELGSLQLAISIAKAEAGLKPDENVDIVAFPARIPIWRRFLLERMPLYGRGMPRHEILDSTLPMDLAKAAEGFFNERMFFLMPYTVDYK
jgi:protease-4